MFGRHRQTTFCPTALRVRETLSAAPRPLPARPRERSRLLEQKLRGADPTSLAEVVRDLGWHQRTGKATGQDVRYLRRADRELTRWLVLQTGDLTPWARRRMWGLVDRTIARYV